MLSEQEPETQTKIKPGMLWETVSIRNMQFFYLKILRKQTSYDVSGTGPEEVQHYLLHNYLKSNLLVYETNKFDYPLKEE